MKNWMISRRVCRTIVASGLTVAGCCAVAQPLRMSTSPANAPQASQSAATTEVSQPAQHALTQTFQNAGVRRCLKKIELVTRFLTNQATSGIAVFPMSGKPDDSPLSVSMELTSAAAGNAVAYAGVTYSPRLDDCTAVYETVNWLPGKCEDLMASPGYANLKPTGPLQGQIKTMSNSPHMRMLFIPAGNGCTVIKKEVVH